MVYLENLLCFHYRPLFDDKSGSFSQTWPSPLPPITMLLQGRDFERTDPTLYGGRGEGTVKLSKKAKCTITFDQDCTYTTASCESLHISHSPCVTHILVHSSKTSSKTQNEFVDITSSPKIFAPVIIWTSRGFRTYLRYQDRSSCNCSSRNWGEFNSHCRGARMQRSLLKIILLKN